MKAVTLKLLNETDDPKSFGGIFIDRNGRSQLWQFGSKYANRQRTLETVDGKPKLSIEWNADLGGWSSAYSYQAFVPVDEGEILGMAETADELKENEFLDAYRRGFAKADDLQSREAPLEQLLDEVKEALGSRIYIDRNEGPYSVYYELALDAPHSGRRARLDMYPHGYFLTYLQSKRTCTTAADLRVAILEMLEDPEMHRQPVTKT
jgi:hypothetical protein